MGVSTGGIMKLGILFAGQGSQTVGMGEDFYMRSERFREVFDLLPLEKRKIAFEGSEEELSRTENTQPIMVAFGIGVLSELNKILEAKGIKPEAAAGLSLGEYTALYSAGVFDAETALWLVTVRGEAMAEAASGTDFSMAAALNVSREALEAFIEEASEAGKAYIANYNCPGQTVIAGELPAIERISESIKKAGGRTIALSVGGPFHTPFMEPAGEKLKAALEKICLGEMRFPVLLNAVGREKREDEDLRSLLVRQISGSVYFQDIIETMESSGIDRIIEIGPGKALSGFVRKTAKNIRVMNIEKYEDLIKVGDFLEEK